MQWLPYIKIVPVFGHHGADEYSFELYDVYVDGAWLGSRRTLHWAIALAAQLAAKI